MKFPFLCRLLLLSLVALSSWGCAQKPAPEPTGPLQSFSFAASGMSRYESHSFYAAQEAGGVRLRIETWTQSGNEEREVKIDRVVQEPELLPRLAELIRTQKVAAWNGFKGKNASALDGGSFSLAAVYDQGGRIQASGYVKFPQDYQKVRNAVFAIFQPLAEKYKSERT